MTDQDKELNGEVLTELQNQAAAISEQGSKERDLVNQLLGQAQMADSIAKFTSTVAVSKMAYVKENKLYKGLSGMTDLDGRGLVGTWEEFCKLLGTSAGKVNEDINNLQSFGEEALESMSRMGIGYREMRQYRKLPEDEKQALLEAAKTGDKESFVELAEEMISKSTKDKEELRKQLEDKTADYEAQGSLLHETSMNLSETRMDLEKTKRGFQMLKPDEKVTKAREAIGAPIHAIEQDLKNLRTGFDKLTEATDEAGTDERMFMSNQVLAIEKLLIELREELCLPDPDGIDTSWINPDAVAAVEAELGLSSGEELQYDFDKDQYVPHEDDKEQSDETESGQS